MLGTLQLLRELQHEHIQSVSHRSEGESQRCRCLALAVARVDLHLAAIQMRHRESLSTEISL